MNLFAAHLKVIMAEEENNQLISLDWNFLHPNGAGFSSDAPVELFKAEEIEQAIFCLEVINNLDLTLFQSRTHQQNWDLLENDLMLLFSKFDQGELELNGIQLCELASVPKKKETSSPSNFLPISLICSSIMVTSKVLATRSAPLMDILVDKAWTCFVKVKYIIINFLFTHEILHQCKRNKKGLLVQSDFAKAFDL